MPVHNLIYMHIWFTYCRLP